jgi:flagellin-like protein
VSRRPGRLLRISDRADRPPDRDRGLSPVVGTTLLVGLTVLLAATAGAAVLSGATVVGEPVSHATLSCSATPGTDRIACVHTGGDRLDVRAVTVEIEVGGRPLARQPPVPFFAARGFHGGPTGPFNSAADPHWSAGETAAVRLASTNRPGLTPGDRVVVRVTRDEQVVAAATTTA